MTKIYSVSVGNVKMLRKKSREAVKYIAELEGFTGFHPCYPYGTLCFFDSKNNAIKGKNLMEAKGIKTGTNICSWTLADDGVPVFDEGQGE